MNSGQEQLRDIHPPLLLPEAPDYTLLIAGILLLFLLLAVVLWFFRFRKKKIILVPAHETALTDLQLARRLMTMEEAKQYAGEISMILRRYIEQRFHISTTRQTTKEFFTSLTRSPRQTTELFDTHSRSLHECLDQCDLAKFARCRPDKSSMEKMEAAIQDFIVATREETKGGK
jgi:LPXTG-motif cell wall-anchored protein